MLVAVIIGCEVPYWILLLTGLTVRYPMRRRRAGGILLVCTPLVDLVLLTVSVLDLRAGGTAAAAHTLAAIYIGVSIGFGPRLMQWADVRFTHRFAGGPAPVKPPRSGPGRAAHSRRAWFRHLPARGVGVGLILLAVLLIGEPTRTEQLLGSAKAWTSILLIDAAVSFGYPTSPRTLNDSDDFDADSSTRVHR